jgi:hypothetical protein
MRCNYCPSSSPLIEHRDLHRVKHLSKHESCPNAPEDVRKDAQRFLMQKGGITASQISDTSDGERSSPINVDEIKEPANKKQKSSKSQTIATKRTMDAFVDRNMTAEETDKSNIRLLWFVIVSGIFEMCCIHTMHTRFLVHSNTAFSASENPFFLKWVKGIRPSYIPASRYVLTNRYLVAEEA